MKSFSYIPERGSLTSQSEQKKTNGQISDAQIFSPDLGNYSFFFGIMGPTGIGKNWVGKKLSEHPLRLSSSQIVTPDKIKPMFKMTDRDPRTRDLQDGVLPVSSQVFDSYIERGAITGLHSPFTNGKRYGWLAKGWRDAKRAGELWWTDINTEVLEEVAATPGFEDSHMVALVGSEPYRAYNLTKEQRKAGWPHHPLSRDDSDQIGMRLASGSAYIDQIQEMYERGLIHEVITVDFGQRDRVADIVRESLERRLKS